VSINQSVVGRLVEMIREHVPAGGKVVLFGLAYKPDTHIIEESQSIMVAEGLARVGYACVLHDPLAIGEARKALGDLVQYVDDPYDGLLDADAIMLLANLPEYRQLDWSKAARLARGNALLVDSWRALRECDIAGFRYKGIGLGSAPEQRPRRMILEPARNEDTEP